MSLEIESTEQQEVKLSEHDQAMVDVVDKSNENLKQTLQTDAEKASTIGTEPEPEEGEKLLAGKYKNVEELEKAYTELQSKLGKADAPSEEDTAPVETNEAESAVEAAGLDFASLESEYDTQGGLSEDSFKKLEQAGIPRSAVDQYIAGQTAMQNTFADRIQSDVGGETEYNSMIEWASNNLSSGEQKAFNSTLDNEDSARFAVQGLYSRFKMANPQQIGSSRLSGQTSTATSGYETKSDMMRDIKHPDYKSDARYRARVQSKIGKSSF